MIADWLLSAAAIAAVAAGTGKAPCPSREVGSKPWVKDTGLMPGDFWAWVHLKIDTDGRALSCGIGATNISSQNTKSNLCRSYLASWKTVPLLRDGKPIKTTVKRYTVIMGDKHADAERKARKQFFRDNPGERPECYPQ